MATNIILVQDKNTTTDQINNAFVRLMRFRVDKFSLGYNTVTFYCMTNTPEGLLDNIKPLPYVVNEKITDESYLKILLFGDIVELAMDHCKNIILSPKLIPQDLCQRPIMLSIPPAGNISELPEDFDVDTETLLHIKEHKLPYLQMPCKWWNIEGEVHTEFLGDWFMGYNATDLKSIKDTFLEDPATHIETYKDIGGVQAFIEKEFKGVVIPTKVGQFSPFYPNDDAKIIELNKQWVEHVQPYFPTEYLSPNDEDMMANYISVDHEWRTINPQTQWVYMMGNEDPFTDMYARLWLL
jgi:hypothetical protein